jgi:hypothetical protein
MADAFGAGNFLFLHERMVLEQPFQNLKHWLEQNDRMWTLQALGSLDNLEYTDPQLCQQLLHRVQLAFPSNLNFLFVTVADLQTVPEAAELLMTLLRRFRSLGLPPRYDFVFTYTYNQWLTNHGYQNPSTRFGLGLRGTFGARGRSAPTKRPRPRS